MVAEPSLRHANVSKDAGTLDNAGGPSGAAGRPDARLREIDGLHGWAALLVVGRHAFWETYGVIVPGARSS